jgi:hypothetical protein
MIPSVSAWEERKASMSRSFGVVAFAFKDSSSAELFYSTIRRRKIWVHASNESIRILLQQSKSTAKTNYLIRKARWW